MKKFSISLIILGIALYFSLSDKEEVLPRQTEKSQTKLKKQEELKRKTFEVIPAPQNKKPLETMVDKKTEIEACLETNVSLENKDKLVTSVTKGEYKYSDLKLEQVNIHVKNGSGEIFRLIYRYETETPELIIYKMLGREDRVKIDYNEKDLTYEAVKRKFNFTGKTYQDERRVLRTQDYYIHIVESEKGIESLTLKNDTKQSECQSIGDKLNCYCSK